MGVGLRFGGIRFRVSHGLEKEDWPTFSFSWQQARTVGVKVFQYRFLPGVATVSAGTKRMRLAQEP